MSDSADSDLQWAVSFVVQRITNHAQNSGNPLSENEVALLSDLPKQSVWLPFVEPDEPVPVPRDTAFENLCRHAKVARTQDTGRRVDAKREWDLAATILKLYDHPMSWLLAWGGFKERRPWWDRWLLFLSGCVYIACMFVVFWFSEDHLVSERARWIIVVCVAVLALLALGLILKKFERWELKRTVNKLRRKNAHAV